MILAVAFEPLTLALLGGMAAVHLVMGLLILGRHGWANYLVAVWSGLLLLAGFVGIGLQAAQQRGGSNIGSLLGLLIAGALLYYAVANLSSLRKARAAGLEA